MGLVTTQPNPPCAIYARRSPMSEREAGENFSIESQLHEMRALALKKYGCDSPDEYIDKDKTGSTLDRPELDRLRENLASKRYHGGVIIAYSPDRWTRGGDMDSAVLQMELEKGGARLDFCSGSYENTAEGQLAFDVQNSVSKYERAKFRERAARCRRQKSRHGHPHACKPPDGYKYEGHKFGKKGEYVVVIERAKIIVLIFIKTAEGMTNTDIARWLNAQGIPTHSVWRKSHGMKVKRVGLRWYRNSVAQILNKKTYLGEMIQNGEKITVPAIISRELWDRAHDALAVNKAGRVGRSPREYELSGLLWCARCGARCTTFPQHGDNAAYRCNNIDHVERGVRYCHAPQIRKKVIEPAVWKAIWDAVENPALLWQLIEAYHDRVADRPTKKDPVMARIERARRAVAHAEKVMRDPDKPIAYDQAKADLEAARREFAAAQIAGGALVVQMPLRRDVEAAAAALRSMRHKLKAFPERREALQLLVEKIRYADGLAEIHCHLPAAAAMAGSESNCHSRIRGNGNSSDSISFVINCPIPEGRKRRAA